MKNNRLVKNLATFLAVFMCISLLTAHAANAEAVTLLTLTEQSQAFYQAQAESVRVYNNLLDSFGSDVVRLNTETNVSEQRYPDYYGGAYIAQNGELIIKVTNTTTATASVANLLNSTAGVTYELCEVSYNQLEATLSYIVDRTSYYEENGIIIDTIGIDEETGKIIANVNALDENKLRFLASDISFDYVEWRTATQEAKADAYGGGYTVTNGSQGGTSTIGFAAKKGTVNGFVIAGHAGSVGDTMKCSGTTIGKITHNAYSYNTNADAAFVTANSGISGTHVLKSGDVITGAETGSLPKNTRVYKYGKSTGWTNGTITLTGVRTRSYNALSDEYFYVNNCVQTNYYCEAGDSGGPVVYSAGTSGSYILCGIHISHVEEPESGENESFYTPYANIAAELDITCVTGS